MNFYLDRECGDIVPLNYGWKLRETVLRWGIRSEISRRSRLLIETPGRKREGWDGWGEGGGLQSAVKLWRDRLDLGRRNRFPIVVPLGDNSFTVKSGNIKSERGIAAGECAARIPMRGVSVTWNPRLRQDVEGSQGEIRYWKCRRVHNTTRNHFRCRGQRTTCVM